MKRKNIYIVLFAVTAYCFSGCSDFLDTRLDVIETPEKVSTRRATMANFANAYYAPIQYGITAIDSSFFAAASDEAQQTAPISEVSFFNIGAITPDRNPLSKSYKNYYEGIRAAYYYLDYAKDGEAFLALNRDTAAVVAPDGTMINISNRLDYQRDIRQLNWRRAEAMIAMAYYYSELSKMYGGVPIVTSTLDNDPNAGKLVSSSYDAVVEHIVSLIDNNLNKLNTDWRVRLDEDPDWNFRGDIGRFDKTAALAIKARTLLYAASPRNNPGNDVAKWRRAAQAAYDVIRIREEIFTKGFGFGTTLTPQITAMPEDRDYGAYFLGVGSTENLQSIFLVRKQQSRRPEIENYPVGTRGGNSGVTPSQNLVDAYEYIGEVLPENPYANRDPRLQASIVVNGSTWNGREINQSPGGSDDMQANGASKTGYYIKKFLTPNMNLVETTNADHVWPVYRYAEVLLNYAEAMNEAYGPDGTSDFSSLTARQALMEVRNSASTALPPVTTTNKDEFRTALKRERQVEFAFEDHRYWDLIRWGDAYTVLNQPIRGVSVGKNAAGYTYQNITVSSRVFLPHHIYLPFPRSEVTNSGGAIIQNPGYN